MAIQFDPMADGGCPQCKWIGDAYGQHLEETCALHTKIADLSQDLSMTRDVLRSLERMIDETTQVLGGDAEENPAELAKIRMEELRVAEDAAVTPDKGAVP